MTGTRVPARDSSLRDRKAPGNVSLTHPAAPPGQCSAEATATASHAVESAVNYALRPTPSAARRQRLWLSFFAMPSIRSAAVLKAATMAAWVAWCARRPRAGVLQGGMSASRRFSLLAGLGQFVGDHQRRHHGQPRVADLAELAAQRDDALVEVLGELLQMVLLAVLAGHAELAAVDGDIHLRHGTSHVVCNHPAHSRTKRMFSIAASSRCAMSRLAASSLRACAAAHRGRRRAWSGRRRARGPARPAAPGCGRSRCGARPRRRAYPAPG